MTTIDEVRQRGFEALESDDPPMPVRLVIVSDGADGEPNELRQYFAPEPLEATTTLSDLINDGGLLIIQRVTEGEDAALVKSEVGDRATIVQVGPYDAALVWADPFFEGSRRSFNVYWSDGSYDFALIAGLKTPEEAVETARSLHC